MGAEAGGSHATSQHVQIGRLTQPEDQGTWRQALHFLTDKVMLW